MGEDPLARGMHGLGEGVGGFKLMRAPVGDSCFERGILKMRVGGIKRLIEALPSLDNPHIEFVLLWVCFALPKFTL